ncbi:protein charybde [Folsomia candida]|uniref:Protein charybde n=1 Tax=Folsomia candida TaxID=158441 RepID=A0A226DGI9_FOLCA|nr:protein charybde [Folsomia candida]OXA43807.1 Protein charybde [Folsomia candida]
MEVIAKPVALHPFHRDLPGETRSAVQHVDFVEAAEIDDDGGAVMTLRWLTGRLETALRLAKKAHLDCGQVLLPPSLLVHIASDIVGMAETEPCGLRGALIILHFQGSAPAASSEIGQLRGDQHLPPTFQLHLTLKEEEAPWYEKRLPQFIRSWTKGRTIVVGEGYTLAKRKLYRSSSSSSSH